MARAMVYAPTWKRPVRICPAHAPGTGAEWQRMAQLAGLRSEPPDQGSSDPSAPS
ncbi:MAG: hypothetical protein ACOC9O_02125 [Myxococcota bacterium]